MNLRFFIPAIFVPVMWFPSSFAGPPPDSLLQKRDTSSIDLYLSLGEELISESPKQAFAYARAALALSEDMDNAYRVARSNQLVARVYQVTGIFDKALDYMLKALHQFKILGDTLQIGLCYEDIGVVYRLSGDFQQSFAYLNDAIGLNKQQRNYRQIAVNYMNMGLGYLMVDSTDKGLSYFMVSYMIADSLKMEKEKMALLNHIGKGFARLGKYQDALRHFYRVLDIVGRQPDDLVRAEALVNIGSGYFGLKNYPAALHHALRGYELAREKNFTVLHSEAARLLSDIYARQGNYRQSYQYLSEFLSLSDSVLNNERTRQLVKLQTLYELNLKEQENASLRLENIHNRRQMRTRTLVIVLITCLLLVLAVLLYMLNRMNNRQLGLNAKLASQSNELESLNEMKDRFFAFVAHNLKNPFNTIMGFAELMQRSTDAKDLEKTRQYSTLIYDLSSQVQKVLANLLEWSRLQRRSFEAKPEVIDLSSLVTDVIEMHNKDAARKDISLSVNMKSRVMVTADRSMITTVLQNLLINALEHTPVSGQISIRSRKKGTMAEVAVTDSGAGIAEADLQRLFHLDFSLTRVGKSETGGAGLGLIICYEMINKNGGSIEVKSKVGKGASFKFSLPLAPVSESEREKSEPENGVHPEDLHEELLNRNLPLSAEALTTILGEVKPRFDDVSKVLSIENLEAFSASLIQAARKHDIANLLHYGKTLESLTRKHQIDQIMLALPVFREYLEMISKIN
jgi:signal transduction histidine kinase